MPWNEIIFKPSLYWTLSLSVLSPSIFISPRGRVITIHSCEKTEEAWTSDLLISNEWDSNRLLLDRDRILRGRDSVKTELKCWSHYEVMLLPLKWENWLYYPDAQCLLYC